MTRIQISDLGQGHTYLDVTCLVVVYTIWNSYLADFVAEGEYVNNLFIYNRLHFPPLIIDLLAINHIKDLLLDRYYQLRFLAQFTFSR